MSNIFCRSLTLVLALAAAQISIVTTANSATYLYASNALSMSINAFSINMSSGALASLGTATSTDPQVPSILAITPDARFLYTGNGAGGVLGFAINSGSGALSSLGSPFAGGDANTAIAITPDGRFLYTADYANSVIKAFSINTSTGALTAVTGSFSTGNSPFDIAITPDGKYLYTANFGASPGASDISAFSINSSTGTLTPVPGTFGPGGGEASAIQVTPDGKYLYISNSDSTVNTVSAFSINSNGTLSSIGTFSTGSGPYLPAIAPDGKYMYVPNHNFASAANSTISAFAINPSSGSLSSVSGLFTTGPNPLQVVIAPGGKFLYSVNSNLQDGGMFGTGSITQFSVDSGNGSLSAVAGGPSLQNVSSSAAITPAQGPTASFTTGSSGVSSRSGSAVTFDASNSTDPDGSIATYSWDFGDGQTSTSSSATVTHTYAQSGEYPVTLTVTDATGCSTTVIWASRMAFCNGSPAATVQKTVAASSAGASLRAKAKQHFNRKGILVKAKCGSDCRAKLKGVIRIRGSKLRLKPRIANLKANQPRRFRVRLRAKGLRRFRRLFPKAKYAKGVVTLWATVGDKKVKDTVTVKLI